MFQAMTASDDDEKALDNFNAAIAKAVVKQVTESDTVKRLQEQQRQYKAGAVPPSGCAGLPADLSAQARAKAEGLAKAGVPAAPSLLFPAPGGRR